MIARFHDRIIGEAEGRTVRFGLVRPEVDSANTEGSDLPARSGCSVELVLAPGDLEPLIPCGHDRDLERSFEERSRDSVGAEVDVAPCDEGSFVGDVARQEAFDNHGLPATACVAVTARDADREYCTPLPLGDSAARRWKPS